jgi:hypothetical protein
MLDHNRTQVVRSAISWQPQLQILIPHFTSSISTASKESVGDLPIRVYSRGRGCFLSSSFTTDTKTMVRSFSIEHVVVGFAAKKVVEAVDTDLVAAILHASSPSSSDWVGSKSVCLSGGAFCHGRPQRPREGPSPMSRIFFSRSSFRWDGISWRPKPIGTSCSIYSSCPFFLTS